MTPYSLFVTPYFPMNHHGLHHLHRRKRVHNKKYQPYPHPHKFKALIDHLVYFVGIIGPMFGAVQAYKIWSTQNAAGVSVMMFGSHIFFQHGLADVCFSSQRKTSYRDV